MATKNPFDKAARYAVKLDPAGFFSWVFDLPCASFNFRGWLDTRQISFPGGEDRTGDTVADLANLDQSGLPWAVALEFQIAPDATMFGRMLVYLGGIWLGKKPDDERGSRFCVGGVVVNLTGVGNSSRSCVWSEAGIATTILLRECNIERELAANCLQRIGQGQTARTILPWIPLMTGADELAIVEQWKHLAEAEPDPRRRADYVALARIFADATGKTAFWTEQLRGWNVLQSSVVNEWMNEGRQEGRQEGLRVGQIELLEAQLTTRFGTLPELSLTALRAMTLEQLRTLSVKLLSAKSLPELGL